MAELLIHGDTDEETVIVSLGVVAPSFLLLESSSFILLEDGSKIKLQ
jgi:hypothetical protein